MTGDKELLVHVVVKDAVECLGAPFEIWKTSWVVTATVLQHQRLAAAQACPSTAQGRVSGTGRVSTSGRRISSSCALVIRPLASTMS